jgi:hypothetical protein
VPFWYYVNNLTLWNETKLKEKGQLFHDCFQNREENVLILEKKLVVFVCNFKEPKKALSFFLKKIRLLSTRGPL